MNEEYDGMDNEYLPDETAIYHEKMVLYLKRISDDIHYFKSLSVVSLVLLIITISLYMCATFR